MRRWWMLLGLLLAACGGGGSSSPTANAEATTTRSAEQTLVAGVLTPAAASGSAVARATTGVPSVPSLLTPSGSATQPPGASSGSAPSGTAPVTAASSGTPIQVVKVTADDGANVRDKPDINGEVIAKLDFGAEIPPVETNVTGTDGTSKWVRISVAGKTGFVRSDLVTGPQAPSPTKPPATPGAAPTATAKP